MRQLPEPPADSRPPYWDFWRHDLWARAQAGDPAGFWHWPCVRHCMTVEHFPVSEQLADLQSHRWLPVIQDAHPHHARNLIHQAYHLKRWEDATGRLVEDLETIFEFGAGYGAMADLVRRLGFRGRYLVHDLPEFALLQRYFLGARGIAVEHVEAPQACDLFIGLYSLSEIPVAGRGAWLVGSSYLLLYSGRFAEYDNAAWAQAVAATRPDLEWVDEPFPGRPDSYLIGWRP